MPGYKTHLVGGLAVYGVTLYLLRSYCGSALVAAEWLLFCLAGSLFPDVDTKSKGRTFFYHILLGILIVFAVQRKFLAMGAVAIFALVPLITRHRGLFHQIWFVIGLPVIVAFIIGFYATGHTRIIMFNTLFFIVGAISHLFLDFGIIRSFKFRR